MKRKLLGIILISPIIIMFIVTAIKTPAILLGLFVIIVALMVTKGLELLMESNSKP